MDMDYDSGFTIDDYPRLGRVFLPLSLEIMIDGKLMDPWNDANVLVQKREFFNRYKYLYENAAIILALFLNSSYSYRINKEIYDKCGIMLNKKEKHALYKDNFEIIDYLEEFVLGDTHLKFTRLFDLVEEIKDKKDVFSRIKKEYSFEDKNIGFSKYDLAFKTVLDLVRSHVFAQDPDKTLYYKKGNKAYERVTVNGRLFDESTVRITKSEINHKISTLDCFYQILSYSNDILESHVFTNTGFSYEFPTVNKSFVIYNPFLGAFTKHGKFNRIIDRTIFTEDEKRDMYFTLHDELPKTFSSCSSSCPTFKIEEEDVFFYEDKFNYICPGCGNVCDIDIPNKGRLSKLGDRIRDRALDSKTMDKKLKLLSELVTIDGYETYKELIKKKDK